MSNDSGVIEHITIPSLSSASFADKRCTGSILVIPARTSSIAGIVLWNTSEAFSKKLTDQRYGKSALPWNRRNWYLTAKHLAWRDYSQFQKRTQVHEGEHTFPVRSRMSRQEGGPLRHVQIRGILPGIVLQLQSQLDKLEDECRRSSSCSATLDAIEQQSCHGMHPRNDTREFVKFYYNIKLIKCSHDGQCSSHE